MMALITDLDTIELTPPNTAEVSLGLGLGLPLGLGLGLGLP